jgi:hypothetical protein
VTRLTIWVVWPSNRQHSELIDEIGSWSAGPVPHEWLFTPCVPIPVEPRTFGISPRRVICGFFHTRDVFSIFLIPGSQHSTDECHALTDRIVESLPCDNRALPPALSSISGLSFSQAQRLKPGPRQFPKNYVPANLDPRVQSISRLAHVGGTNGEYHDVGNFFGAEDPAERHCPN